MHSAVLLANENERLRSANERKKKKESTKRLQFSKKVSLTVDEANNLIQPSTVLELETEVAEEVVGEAIEEALTRENRYGLPSCFICKGFNHVASECPKYR